jgi:UDP:flavonoid glycosyltransferase YjiC (YdhE family)
VAPPPRGAVVLTTIGSLGDLYPVLAVARALEEMGTEARLALPPDDCEVARRWGLPATPFGPSHAELTERMGMTRDEIAESVLRDPSRLTNRAAIPMLGRLVPELEEIARGAGAVAGTTFALAAPVAAERMALPFVPLLLQPMLTFSALDPPRLGPFRLAVPRPRGRVALAWNRTVIGAARLVLRARLRRRLDGARRGLGLGPQGGTPLLDYAGHVPMRLGLWSQRFAPLPGDAPADLRAVGFPPAPPGALPPEAARWLAEGPPPLVVTLGSIAQGLAGPAFWDEAAAMARAMGLRAVLLHGEARAPKGPDLLPLAYAPHAALFPQAAAILHHGGIGTTAEALRAGKPQLVLPVGGDQPDNAARLVRLGLAATLPARRFTAQAGRAALEGLVDRFDHVAAQAVAAEIAAEDGAVQAALHLTRVAQGIAAAPR